MYLMSFGESVFTVFACVLFGAVIGASILYHFLHNGTITVDEITDFIYEEED